MDKRKAEEKYADIINLPHHVSKKHKPMDIIDRAAQFAPFAALGSLEDLVKEETGPLSPEHGDGKAQNSSADHL